MIRHTSVAVGKNICYGQSDVAVSAHFEAESTAYKAELPDEFEAVYSSPLSRCVQLTAQLVPHFELVEALKEMNFGDWELQKWQDIDAESLNEWMQDFVHIKPPNGENLTVLFERVKAFLDTLRQKEYNKVLIVAHAGVIRCVWAYLLEIPLQNCFKIPVGYGEIFRFTLMKNAAWDNIQQKK